MISKLSRLVIYYVSYCAVERYLIRRIRDPPPSLLCFCDTRKISSEDSAVTAVSSEIFGSNILAICCYSFLRCFDNIYHN